MREKLTRERFLAYVANVPQAAPRADTGNSPVLHCEATFTGGAHGRFNRPAHDVSAKQCHSHSLGCYAVGASARASLRTPLPWRPRRRASISWGFAVHNYSITLPKP